MTASELAGAARQPEERAPLDEFPRELTLLQGRGLPALSIHVSFASGIVESSDPEYLRDLAEWHAGWRRKKRKAAPGPAAETPWEALEAAGEAGMP